MASIEKTVFISYRRKDISWALAVYQYLTNKKYDVFFDYTSIRSGDFAQVITSNIRARAHFLLILTPTSLDRYNEPDDWLKREIDTAIDERRNIIPLFFEGFSFNSPIVAKKLTGKLSLITRYNGLEIPPGYFMEAMERLSEKFLDVPLDAVLHPVSKELKEANEREQRAVNQVLELKRDDIDELVKPAEENIGATEGTQIETSIESPFNPSKWIGGESQQAKLRWYGIGALFLIAMALGIAGINILQQKKNELKPTQAPIVFPLTSSPMASQTLVRTSTLQVTPTSTSVPSPTFDRSNTKVSQQDGMTLIFVPAGKFMMGSNNGKLDEKPVHEVFLDTFWIDQTEVTNGMYAECVGKGSCVPPVNRESHTHLTYYGNPEFDNYPVVYVDWNMARAYCEWAGRRLPTEAEWEKAARGDDQRTYPWGNEIPNNDLVNYNGAVGDTTKVGKYSNGASPYGVLDMAGNVWEWVADYYDSGYYYKSSSVNPMGPTRAGIKNYRVLRGGSWNGTSNLIYSSLRRGYEPTHTDYYLGFRCASSN